MLRLICISDTHSLHRQIAVPDGDVLIHAGDLTRRGELDELRDFNEWLGTLPHTHKLVIAGNHDHICEEVSELIRNSSTTPPISATWRLRLEATASLAHPGR